MKKILLFLFWFSIILAWCGTSKTQKIDFDGFAIDIDQTYKKTDWTLVENKQIINKVIKAYKKPASQKDWFDVNVMIAKTTVSEGLSGGSFGQINVEKLQANIQWTKIIKTADLNFKCKWTEINGTYSIISIPQEWEDVNNEKRKSYYINQYYFVSGKNWYIISFSSDVQKDAENFVNVIKKITCN